MLIDWFTVGAQVLNFLILMWLLKRLLYKPILDAIDVREKRIAAELSDAATRRSEAERERDDFQNKNKAFDEERSALLTKAADEAKVERERLFDDARNEANGLRAKQEAALRNDRTRLGNEMARLATDEVFGIARKTLADLATVSLEQRLGEVFTRRLREMDGKAKEALSVALKSAEPALVKSAFDLPTDQRAAIQNALNETFSAEVRVRFEAAPGAICGIELSANGQKVAWSIASYLQLLEQKVDELIEAQSTSATKTAPSTNGAVKSTSVAQAEAH
jgi:F-type H+-transporting ATPase subunit b